MPHRRPSPLRRCIDWIGALAGYGLFVVGMLATITVFGAIVGVPMIVAGLGLVTTADRC